jgi:hypothetical protein
MLTYRKKVALASESITTLLTSGADIFFKINFFNEKGQDHHGPALKTII